jgi:GNAT superfamily N-acetyltransferase
MHPQYVHQFYAENGLLIRVRPMTASDGPYLVDLFAHLGSDSRYRRFNLPLDEPDEAWVQQQADAMAALPPFKGRAWLAFAALPDEEETIVGGIRYVSLTPDSAEMALSVRDDLQGFGIGTELIIFAGRKAYAAGMRTLVGYVQSGNRALWASLDHLQIPVQRFSEGPVTRIEVDLRRAKVFHWTPDKNDRRE